jgi:hypothetical protein
MAGIIPPLWTSPGEILGKKALEVRGRVKDWEKGEKVRGLVRKLKGWENGSV